MATEGKKISAYNTNLAPNTSFFLVGSQGNTTYKIASANLFANATGDVVISANAPLVIGTLRIPSGNAPSNSTATVIRNTMWHDGDYLYVAVANNVIKRVTLTSF